MAKPLTPSVLAALATPVGDLTPIQIFELAQGGFLEVKEGALQFSKKSERGEKRTARKEAIEAIRGKVMEATLAVAGGNTEKLFRLDDVLKASGLDKAQHRDNILQCLRDFRDEGMLETVKQSDNNFQIFWKATPELLS